MREGDFVRALAELGWRWEEVEEEFVRSGGPGGQNVNKVATAVVLRHRPSGLVLRAEEARTQGENRRLARLRLIERLRSVRQAADRAKAAARSKRRRQEARRGPAAKRKQVEAKRHRARIKAGRGRLQEEG
ncbi:MAG: peptide chain release factor-like protein [Verrucomicrobiia bacterium]